MAHIEADRVKETTTTVGTGDITLGGAVSGFQAFSATMANGDTTWYCIAGGAEWEIGLGTWNTGNTLTRTTVLKSSNANALVNFSAGTKDIFQTIPADNLGHLEPDGSVEFNAVATDPATPPGGILKMYAKTIGGRTIPKWVGPSGVDTPIQPFLGMNTIRSLYLGSAVSATTLVLGYNFAYTMVAGGTNVQTTAATGSLKSRTRLGRLVSAATAGAMANIKGNYLECGRETGFFFVARFALDLLIANNLGFWGLYASTTAAAATINHVTSTAVAKVGLAIATNTGNWQLVACSGTAVTATDLGATFPVNTTDLMELVLFCAPGGTSISYRVTNLTTGATTTGALSTNIPGATTYMTLLETLSNNATASAVQWSFKSMYLETDY